MCITISIRTCAFLSHKSYLHKEIKVPVKSKLSMCSEMLIIRLVTFLITWSHIMWMCCGFANTEQSIVYNYMQNRIFSTLHAYLINSWLTPLNYYLNYHSVSHLTLYYYCTSLEGFFLSNWLNAQLPFCIHLTTHLYVRSFIVLVIVTWSHFGLSLC